MTRAASTRDDGFEARVGQFFESKGFVPVRRGWPDYAIFHRDGTLRMLVEVKAPGDRVSFAQQLIHDALRAAGIEVLVVREKDIPRLREQLSGESRRGSPPAPDVFTPANPAYCTDLSCTRLLRHEWHPHAKPSIADVAAAAMRRSEMLRNRRDEPEEP